jgi:hypothetical protein
MQDGHSCPSVECKVAEDGQECPSYVGSQRSHQFTKLFSSKELTTTNAISWPARGSFGSDLVSSVEMDPLAGASGYTEFRSAKPTTHFF